MFLFCLVYFSCEMFIYIPLKIYIYICVFPQCFVIFALNGLSCWLCPTIRFKVLSEKPSEHQRQLLSVIMKTYKAIEGNMGEQNKKISANLDLSERHSQIQESDTFKEFQKSLDLLVEQSPNSTATDMLLILDKYSNVLIDIISSKVTKRETLIE